ncbi:MAG: diguanylate cyclase [Bdellovibrionaceae bacterium]|nr:diguanylate cyclase [Bdellovibrio sp.]
MNIREHASAFSVYVLSQDADLGARIRFALSQASYDVYFFADVDELFMRLKINPPHVVILDYESLVAPLAEVVEKILSVSTEIKIVCVSNPEHFTTFGGFQNYNLVLFFDRNGQAVERQVQSGVDLICENLYRLYQNEQVYETFQHTKQELEQMSNTLNSERNGPQVRPFQMRISEYRSAESKEDLLQIFFRQAPAQSWVFLKYIKSIRTYISVSNQNMPENWVEGLSFKILPSEEDFNQKVMIGEFPSRMIQYIQGKWDVNQIKMLPLIIKEEVEGILITTQEITAAVAEDFSLMNLVYSLLSLEAQPAHLDVEDTLTGFYNQLFYKRILEKEIDRSKRSFAPISVIKLAIDSFREIEVSQGREFCDEIIKKVANVIKKTSRLPDFACRTAENEFSIILTNCNRKGAALRSERLRQELKLETFSKVGFMVTVSQGISEYPSLTKSSDSLTESARKALDFISAKGPDKICIFKAPQGHQPDFQVNT